MFAELKTLLEEMGNDAVRLRDKDAFVDRFGPEAEYDEMKAMLLGLVIAAYARKVEEALSVKGRHPFDASQCYRCYEFISDPIREQLARLNKLYATPIDHGDKEVIGYGGVGN